MPRRNKIAEAAKIAAWAKDHPKEIKNTSESSELIKRPLWLEYAVIRLALFLGIAGIGVTLMFAGLFKAGVALLYLGLLVTAIDLRYEKFFRKLNLSIQFLVFLIYVIVIAFISWKWIFVPAHFQLSAVADVPHYGPKSNIDGIPWRNEYSKLGFYIINNGDIDYDNFDAEISTDLVFADMRFVHGISECKIAGLDSPTEVHWQHLEGDVPTGPVDGAPYDYKILQIGPDGKRRVSGTDWTYRISCNRLLPHSQLDFIAALVVVKGPPAKELFGPPKAATWVSVKSHFRTSGRDRFETFSECPMRQVCETKGSR